MNSVKYLFAILILLSSCGNVTVTKTNKIDKVDPVDYVSILVGTQSKFELSTGNTYPAIARPWGMNFWSERWATVGCIVMMLIRLGVLSKRISQVLG